MGLRNKPLGFILSSIWFYICILVALVGQFLPLPVWNDFDFENPGVGMFSGGHILGTDLDGQDILSMLIHGTRTTMLICIVSVTAAMFIGGLLGILGAYRRGWIDTVISMYFNVTLSIPTLVLVLVMIAIFSSPDPFNPSAGMPRVLVIIISLTLVIIPVLGRLARSAALSWTERDFVLVAESMGMKRRSILWNHIVPNVIPSMMSVGFLAAGVVIVAEGGLAILGAGTNPGESWGSLLAKNRSDIALVPHTTLIPAVVIALTVMALNYFGDYFRQKIDGREARI